MWTLKDFIEVFIQSLVAIGTISAAVFALHGDRIRKWIIKPKLIPTAMSEKPYVQICKKDISDFFDDQKEFETIVNIRLKIINEGRLSAIKTQGFIENIYQKRENNTYFEIRKIPPTSLQWHDNNTVFSIVPNIPAYLNIGVIQKFIQTVPSESHEYKTDEEYYLHIPIIDDSEPNSYINLKKGTFLIPLNLYCESFTKPITYYFEIFWNGLSPEKLDTCTFYFKQFEESDLPKEIKNKK